MEKEQDPPSGAPTGRLRRVKLMLSRRTEAELTAVVEGLSGVEGTQILKVTAEPDALDVPVAPETGAYVWNRNPEFPAYLRMVRERAGLSIRQAAPAQSAQSARRPIEPSRCGHQHARRARACGEPGSHWIHRPWQRGEERVG